MNKFDEIPKLEKMDCWQKQQRSEWDGKVPLRNEQKNEQCTCVERIIINKILLYYMNYRLRWIIIRMCYELKQFTSTAMPQYSVTVVIYVIKLAHLFIYIRWKWFRHYIFNMLITTVMLKGGNKNRLLVFILRQRVLHSGCIQCFLFLITLFHSFEVEKTTDGFFLWNEFNVNKFNVIQFVL